MTDADQHYENRFGSWEFKMAYVRWKYKFRFLAMQMWLQPIGWSSICRFLKFLLTFLWKAKILKKCRIDAGNWPARNSPIEPIQWIIQVIAFIFGWKRERESDGDPKQNIVLLRNSNASRYSNPLVRIEGKMYEKPIAKRIHSYCSTQSYRVSCDSVSKFHQKEPNNRQQQKTKL